jgi:integrase
VASYVFDLKKGRVRLFFRYAQTQFNKTVKVETEKAAGRLCAIVEEALDDLARGKLIMPADADPVTFILSGGKLLAQPSRKPKSPTEVTLDGLIHLYQADPPPNLELSTHKMQKIHFKRLLEEFGDVELSTIDKVAAQTYVSRRGRQKYREKQIQRETITKELQTLRQAWSWVTARQPEISPPTFRLGELSFPKSRQKTPFMSWAQIEKEIARGGLSEEEVLDLWDCLWLDKPQVNECLDHVEKRAGAAFLYPMVCFAAYTGARRSELCRSQISDWKFDSGTVQIRQKKRDKDKTFTYRDVPIHHKLAPVIQEWFAGHPGGQSAFCKSKGEELSWDVATYHFGKTLAKSKWEVVRGWHVFRHSFASNLASGGVDQRKIDRWMGHSTNIRWRYQHLSPDDEQDAIGVL